MSRPTIPELLASIPQVGRLEWIGLSPGRRQPIVPATEAVCRVGTGLAGDHHARGGRGKRQVTLIQAEHLPAIAALLGPDASGDPQPVTPDRLRRNLLVRGFPLRKYALRKAANDGRLTGRRRGHFFG